MGKWGDGIEVLKEKDLLDMGFNKEMQFIQNQPLWIAFWAFNYVLVWLTFNIFVIIFINWD